MRVLCGNWSHTALRPNCTEALYSLERRTDVVAHSERLLRVTDSPVTLRRRTRLVFLRQRKDITNVEPSRDHRPEYGAFAVGMPPL